MPRIRSVHPDICTDEGLVNVSAEAERLYARLWTHLDDDGRCVENALLLKAALFPIHRDVSEQDITRWVNELVLNGQLHRYIVAGRHYLTAKPDRWSTWQKPRRKVDSKHPGPLCADIVGTRTDNDDTRAAGGVGVGGDGDGLVEEGESEGEAERRPLEPAPVDNAVYGLVNRTSAVAARYLESEATA